MFSNRLKHAFASKRVAPKNSSSTLDQLRVTKNDYVPSLRGQPNAHPMPNEDEPEPERGEKRAREMVELDLGTTKGYRQVAVLRYCAASAAHFSGQFVSLAADALRIGGTGTMLAIICSPQNKAAWAPPIVGFPI